MRKSTGAVVWAAAREAGPTASTSVRAARMSESEYFITLWRDVIRLNRFGRELTSPLPLAGEGARLHCGRKATNLIRLYNSGAARRFHKTPPHVFLRSKKALNA